MGLAPDHRRAHEDRIEAVALLAGAQHHQLTGADSVAGGERGVEREAPPLLLDVVGVAHLVDDVDHLSVGRDETEGCRVATEVGQPVNEDGVGHLRRVEGSGQRRGHRLQPGEARCGVFRGDAGVVLRLEPRALLAHHPRLGEGAGEPHRRHDGTALVEDHLAPGQQPVLGAVGPAHPVLGLVGLGPVAQPLQRDPSCIAVVGVHERHPVVERSAEPAGSKAVERLQRSVPGDAPGGGVPVPAAEIPVLEPEQQALAPGPELGVEQPPGGDLLRLADRADDRPVGAGEGPEACHDADRATPLAADEELAGPPAPRADDRQNGLGLRGQRPRDQQFDDVRSDGLGLGPCVEALGGLVPQLDGAVGAGGDGGPGRGIEE